MGRSRGSLTSKADALVDAKGRPVALRLTGGQVHDSLKAEALIKDIGEGDILLALGLSPPDMRKPRSITSPPSS